MRRGQPTRIHKHRISRGEARRWTGNRSCLPVAEDANMGSKEQEPRSSSGGRGAPGAPGVRARRCRTLPSSSASGGRRWLRARHQSPKLRVARHHLALASRDHRHEVDERGQDAGGPSRIACQNRGEGRLKRAAECRTRDAKRSRTLDVARQRVGAHQKAQTAPGGCTHAPVPTAFAAPRIARTPARGPTS